MVTHTISGGPGTKIRAAGSKDHLDLSQYQLVVRSPVTRPADGLTPIGRAPADPQHTTQRRHRMSTHGLDTP